MKKVLVALAVMFGYITYTASNMGETEIAIWFGVITVLAVAAAVSGGKKSGASAGPAKTSRRG